MNYSFLKDVMGSPWQIEGHTLNALIPILRGMTSGLKVDKGTEPQNHKSFRISASTAKGTLSTAAVSDDSSIPGETGVKVINILPLRGVLTKHDQDCGPVGTRTLGTRLLKADADSSVIGHVMVIESGGGQCNAVPELTDAIIKCTKPLVVFIDGMAASAAYYIACYAKEIIAGRSQDVVGSIGTVVLWQGRKSKSEGNKDGVIQVTIYADGAEEKNSEYEQAINGFNFKPAKDNILNPLNTKFKADVLSQRPKVKNDLLTGRTYLASEVIGTLIDSIGSFDFALERVLDLANFKENNYSKGSQSTAQAIPKTPANKTTVGLSTKVSQIKKTDPDKVDWATINNLPHNKHADSN